VETEYGCEFDKSTLTCKVLNSYNCSRINNNNYCFNYNNRFLVKKCSDFSTEYSCEYAMNNKEEYPFLFILLYFLYIEIFEFSFCRDDTDGVYGCKWENETGCLPEKLLNCSSYSFNRCMMVENCSWDIIQNFCYSDDDIKKCHSYSSDECNRLISFKCNFVL
jgi:hypothetical protein